MAPKRDTVGWGPKGMMGSSSLTSALLRGASSEGSLRSLASTFWQTERGEVQVDKVLEHRCPGSIKGQFIAHRG